MKTVIIVTVLGCMVLTGLALANLLEVKEAMEEAHCQKQFLLAQQALDVARTKVAAYEDAVAECVQKAQGHFVAGDEASGLGCRREAQGLALQRARWASKLADASAVLVSERERLVEAIQRRKALRLTDKDENAVVKESTPLPAGETVQLGLHLEQRSALTT